MWEELLDWYDHNGRDLPWRVRGGRPPAYSVWVSEVMLQQTRAEAVIPYYTRFMAALPDIPALAEAQTDLLYKLWEGLGYYSRVRNLRAAAQAVTERHGGVLPADYDALLALPGIGDYTAGAVASIAYGIPVPAVDGNVLRVFARYDGDARDILAPATRRDIRRRAAECLPPARPGDFNQALMDLGAEVCIPGRPRCGDCPLQSTCTACADGTAALLPNRTPKKPRRVETRTVLVLRCGSRAALARRGNRGVLAGQWELPGFDGTLSPQEIAEILGQTPLRTEPLPTAVHVFTHLEWHMTAWRVELESEDPDFAWFDAAEIPERVALPSAFRAWYGVLTAP